MKSIKILGSGCPKCLKTYNNAEEAVKQLNLEAKLEKVENIEKIISYDIFSTPALVVDEEVLVKGRVPDVEEIKQLLNQ